MPPTTEVDPLPGGPDAAPSGASTERPLNDNLLMRGAAGALHGALRLAALPAAAWSKLPPHGGPGLRAAGVRLCEYNPLRSWRRLFSRAVHLRDHRKLLVVDGEVAFVGGVNISGVYAAGSSQARERASGAPPWRDTHLRIAGPLVSH